MWLSFVLSHTDDYFHVADFKQLNMCVYGWRDDKANQPTVVIFATSNTDNQHRQGEIVKTMIVKPDERGAIDAELARSLWGAHLPEPVLERIAQYAQAPATFEFVPDPYCPPPRAAPRKSAYSSRPRTSGRRSAVPGCLRTVVGRDPVAFFAENAPVSDLVRRTAGRETLECDQGPSSSSRPTLGEFIPFTHAPNRRHLAALESTRRRRARERQAREIDRNSDHSD